MNFSIKSFIILSLVTAMAGCASTAPAVKSAAEYFNEGEQAYTEKNYEEAIALWKRVKESYLSPELTTRAELNIADAMYKIGNYIEAAAEYENFRKLHPKHEKAPYALFRLGMCHFQQITGIDTDLTPANSAVTLFTSFLELYPASDLAKEVKAKLDEAVGIQLQHEIYVGRFYLRTEKYNAAIKRLEGVLTRFPSSPLNDETLLLLGQAYMLSGDRSKGSEVFRRLASEYASSRFLDDAKKFMEKNY
jgi:outer membrane protein assembly factor BamD